MGLFESLDVIDSFDRTIERKALVLSQKRAQKQFGNFLSVKPEFNARLAAVDDNLKQIVISICEEVGYDNPKSIYDSVVASFLDDRSKLPFIIPEESFPDRTEIPDYNGPNINTALKDAPTAVGVGESVVAKKKKKEYQEGNVCSSCSNGSCSGCSGGGCSCGCGGTTASKLAWYDSGDEGDYGFSGNEGNYDAEATGASGARMPFHDDPNSPHYDPPCPNCRQSGGAFDGQSCAACGFKAGSAEAMGTGPRYQGDTYAPLGYDGTFQSSVHQADDHWIQKAVKKPGELHRNLGIPQDEKIPESKLEEAEHSDNPKIRERAQFAENVKGLHHGAMPGMEFMQGEGLPPTTHTCENCGMGHYGTCPNCPPQQQYLEEPQMGGDIRPGAGDPWQPGQRFQANSIHEAIKADRDGDTIERHEDIPKYKPTDRPTGLSDEPPVKLDPKTWEPKNMPKLDVNEPKGMHSDVEQDVTQPTEYTGDAWGEDDHRFDSFNNPSKEEDLPAAGKDETRLGDSGFAGNNMDNPQSAGDTWSGSQWSTNPVTQHNDLNTVSHFVSQDEVLRALSAYKG